MTRYEESKEKFERRGVDVEEALNKLQNTPISIHCWQGDDVIGFDSSEALSGGIQTTGNYIGRARNFDELTKDLSFALSLMPGKKRLNLHASYAILGDDLGKVDRDNYQEKHFKAWVDFAKKEHLDGIDFNPTFFSHPKVKDGLTLSSPDEETRRFWINHGKCCLKIAEYFAHEFNTRTLMNIWIPDGLKDVPADRLSPRVRLKESLDEILSIPYDKDLVKVSVESKFFGIGVESYTVGNNEFYQNYAASRGICCLLDNGHYHPSETVSDKIPSLLAFYDNVALHITRPVHWDSDHVVLLEDEIKEIAKEIVRNDALDKVMIGLDYFDASINRIAAWVIGQRSVEKALLFALLQPSDKLKQLQDEADFTRQMYLQEEMKMLPYGDIFKEYLRRNGIGSDWFEKIKDYENRFLKERK